jgi:hypothetical protein
MSRIGWDQAALARWLEERTATAEAHAWARLGLLRMAVSRRANIPDLVRARHGAAREAALRLAHAKPSRPGGARPPRATAADVSHRPTVHSRSEPSPHAQKPWRSPPGRTAMAKAWIGWSMASNVHGPRPGVRGGTSQLGTRRPSVQHRRSAPCVQAPYCRVVPHLESRAAPLRGIAAALSRAALWLEAPRARARRAGRVPKIRPATSVRGGATTDRLPRLRLSG